MKKTHIVWLTLLTVLVFSAFSAASASAEVALWLNNGSEITALTSVDTEGLFTISTLVLGVDVALLHCEDIFDGSVGANGEDEVTELLTTTGGAISLTGLSGTSLSCAQEGGECPTGSLAEVWAINLPWKTQLELMMSSILDLLTEGAGKTGEPAYEVVCLEGTTVKSENLCLGKTSYVETNSTSDVISVLNSESEKFKCNIGESDVEGEGLTLLLTGGPLTVSDP